MDTSETYVKMCDKAEEIQRVKETYGFEKGSFFWRDGSLLAIGEILNLSLPPHIWLPRQDQLQEMVYGFDGSNPEYFKTYVGCPNVICEDILEFSKDDCEMGLSSMEQLWLAFVMQEKYGKVWDGEDWVTG